jgi:ATP-binding cassette subfamily B protein
MQTEPNTIQSLLVRLWQHINPHRRSQFGLLLLLMMLASFAEIISIGAILPFLGVLTAPERVFEHAATQPLIRALRLSKPEQLLLPLGTSKNLHYCQIRQRKINNLTWLPTGF